MGCEGTALADLTERLGGHPNSTRRHLEALLADGQVQARVAGASGTGRPPLLYTTTVEGRHALAAASGAVHRDMLEAAVDYLADLPEGPAMARTMGARWGSQLASELVDEGLVVPDDAVALAVAERKLEQLGFEPTSEGEVIDRKIVLTACPLHDMAAAHPQIVCALHEAMANSLVAGLGAGVRLQLLPLVEPGRCHLAASPA